MEKFSMRYDTRPFQNIVEAMRDAGTSMAAMAEGASQDQAELLLRKGGLPFQLSCMRLINELIAHEETAEDRVGVRRPLIQLRLVEVCHECSARAAAMEQDKQSASVSEYVPSKELKQFDMEVNIFEGFLKARCLALAA